MVLVNQFLGELKKFNVYNAAHTFGIQNKQQYMLVIIELFACVFNVLMNSNL